MKRLSIPAHSLPLILLALSFLGAGTAQATVLILPSSPGWTAGAPAPGQTVSQSFTGTLPNDVTISINNNGASATGATWSPGFPAINSTQTTGGYTGVNGLQLYATATSSTSSFVLTTVSFVTAVTNVSFQLWDVDKTGGSWVDQISAIQALDTLGGTVGATSISSAVAGYNTITGSGLSAVVSGTAPAANNTNQGTINISFLGPITQFSFKWSNTDPALGAQVIGLGQINYSVVPEANTVGGIAGLMVAVGAHEHLRRRKKNAIA